MSKRILVIQPDGSEDDVGNDRKVIKTIGLPSIMWMKETIGGHIELVRVLREDMPGFQYTYMIVNETGLIDGLPRNQRATDIYLANTRRAYPDQPNPSKAASEAYMARFPEGTPVINMNPPGYEDDPYIAGTVVWFDGYTCDELLGMGL